MGCFSNFSNVGEIAKFFNELKARPDSIQGKFIADFAEKIKKADLAEIYCDITNQEDSAWQQEVQALTKSLQANASDCRKRLEKQVRDTKKFVETLTNHSSTYQEELNKISDIMDQVKPKAAKSSMDTFQDVTNKAIEQQSMQAGYNPSGRAWMILLSLVESILDTCERQVYPDAKSILTPEDSESKVPNLMPMPR